MEYIQDFHAKFYVYHICNNKNRASIHAWYWHEKKKSESWSESWYTASRRLIRWCLYLEANDEEKNTVNDHIVNIKKILVACDDDNDP